ncbi:hypothetical protein LAG90_16465 [Marinilongibacter aquaticus]|uniref:hypothetical protein n=1 Tax=Marinilongibacter aquaticus TaxID=2975157 RepID=UPI0021BD47D2|nr:hypothetical protein [Marinilongibacter aquaticus]UBM58399.1 hypothetical protein LAG90_16465 [Marinilongibacter aquaticus]
MTESLKPSLPNWALILIYLLILVILGVFGDLFIFILGAILETVVFAVGYDELHGDH